MDYPLWVWIAFNATILLLLTIDLFVMHKKSEELGIKEALYTSAGWISLALLFNLGLYYFKGEAVALNFFTGYLIEKSLSIDNLFVFLLIFDHFQTPKEYQHKVLFWGILGAVVMRALFIFFGIALVKHFHWVLYLFGTFLIWAGIQMALTRNKEIHPENNFILKLVRKLAPFTKDYRGDLFFVIEKGKRYATPLFLVLLTIEITDVIFAVDSIPAIMAITLDPFIIYTSNIFAILGLRSLFFALSGLAGLFVYLHYGLAAVLCFVGAKMVLEPWIEIPVQYSLGFIVLALAAAVLLSLRARTGNRGDK